MNDINIISVHNRRMAISLKKKNLHITAAGSFLPKHDVISTAHMGEGRLHTSQQDSRTPALA